MSKAYDYIDNLPIDKAVNLVALEVALGTEVDVAIERVTKVHRVSKKKLAEAFDEVSKEH